MIKNGGKLFFYSVFSPKHDLNNLELGVLSKVRNDFFYFKKDQKKHIVKEIGEKKYEYFYEMKDNSPLKWKKFFNGRLLEKSRMNTDNTYSILYQDEQKRLLKISHYDVDHNWLKTEYFNNDSRFLFSKLQDGLAILVSEQKNGSDKSNEYELYPLNVLPSMYSLKTLKDKLPEFFCLTNFGKLSYFNKDQFTEIKNIIKEKSDDLSQKVAYNDDNSILKVIDQEKPLYSMLDYDKIIKTEKETYFYFGDMSKNNRNGFGRTIKSSLIPIYEGFYKDDRKNGLGVDFYDSGNVCYAGNFKENKKDGIGVDFNKIGNIARVSFYKNGEEAKISVCADESGNLFFLKTDKDKKYRILCDYNKKSGKIKISAYTGRVSLFNEDGVIIYNGLMKNNKKSGFGVEYQENGEIKYKGNFENDLYNGEGKLYYIDHKFIGNFIDGKPNGIGTIYQNNGQKISGNFFKEPVDDCKSVVFKSGISYYYI